MKAKGIEYEVLRARLDADADRRQDRPLTRQECGLVLLVLVLMTLLTIGGVQYAKVAGYLA
jgi:hypothetical protein